MKVTKVSSRSVLVSEEAPKGDFLKSKPEPTLQDSAFFAAQVRGLGPLRISSAKAKLKVRQRVEASLQDTFKVPALIDGLTDYLSEVTKEDPIFASLLGV